MGFSASLSGLNVNQQKLNVIGNNLANINTIGFKASTVQFMDLVSQSVGGSSANPMQVGLGVTTGSISPSFKQGGIENTGVPTNVAIQGNGFFVVGDANNRSYTRAGDFSFDADGMLVTSDGLPVQVFAYFLMSESRASLPVGSGVLCLGPPVLRFNHDVLNTGTGGAVAFSPDLAQLPQGQVVLPGETWRFQLWHRDGASSNFSSSLAFTWE